MITPSQRDNLLAQLRSRYNGQRADYWGYPGECVSYARRWLDCIINGSLDGPMVSPPAPGGVNGYGAYYYSQPTDAIRNLFDVLPYDPNGSYESGSLFTYSGSGHVGIMLDNQPGHPTALVSEQNADPDASPVHDAQRVKSHIDGILSLKLGSDLPLWTTSFISPVLKQVRPGSRKWNLGNPDFASVAANPITTAGDNETFTAVALLHHREIPQYNYYVEDANTPHGWNVLDCNDYVAPPPPPPAPQVINTPNVAVNLAEKYTVITKLMVFPSAADAKSLSNYTGTDLEPGTYYVFAKQDNAYNLSTNNVQNQNKWVRITDNVIKPIPEPPVTEVSNPLPTGQPTLPVDAPATDETLLVDLGPQITDVFKPEAPKPQYNWIRDDRLPVRLTSTNSTPVPIHDLEGKYPTQSFPAHRTEDYSMFTVLDNVEYWLPDRTRNKGWMYAVPLQFLPEEPAPTLLDHNANGKYDIVDLFDNGIAGFVDFGSKYLDGIKRAVTVVAPKIEPAKQRIGKTIDGFSARRKK